MGHTQQWRELHQAVVPVIENLQAPSVGVRWNIMGLSDVNLISQQFALKFQVEFYIPNSLFDQLKANDDLRHERLFSFMNAVEIMEGPTVSVLANPKENGQIVKVLTKVKFEQHFDQSHFPWDMHDFTVQGATWLLSASVSIISTMTSSKEPFGSGYMLC
eukprot:m.331605 g.331605  ORF g.331605 m.331605 type:complete len:160 (+) comp20483_c1_seq2:276-755(+)